MQHEAPWFEVHNTEAFLFNWGDAFGIEMRSTESRCKAPLIEVRSDEAYLFNWGDAFVIEVRSTVAFN